jgi:hypothetical protein
MKEIMEQVENPILRAHRLGLDDGIAGRPVRRKEDFGYVGWISYCRGYREGQEEARQAKYDRAAARRAKRKHAAAVMFQDLGKQV